MQDDLFSFYTNLLVFVPPFMTIFSKASLSSNKNIILFYVYYKVIFAVYTNLKIRIILFRGIYQIQICVPFSKIKKLFEFKLLHHLSSVFHLS